MVLVDTKWRLSRVRRVMTFHFITIFLLNWVLVENLQIFPNFRVIPVEIVKSSR